MKSPYTLPSSWAEEPEESLTDDLTLLRRVGVLPEEGRETYNDEAPEWAEYCF